MINTIKKMILTTLIFMLISINCAYGLGEIYPSPEDDLNFMREKIFNSSNVEYSYNNLHVGSNLTGKLGSRIDSKSKMPVYILNVEKEGMITLEIVPINKMYAASAEMNVYYVSSISGEKKYYSPDVNSYLPAGPGHEKRTFYAYPGKYFISVGGHNYSKEGMVTNDQIYLDFSIKAAQETYRNDPNGNDIVSDSTPYVLNISNPISFYGNVYMKSRWSGDRWYKDTSDVYTFTPPKTGQIKVSFTNIDSTPLRLFTTETIHTRDSNNKSNWENTLSNEWKDHAYAWARVSDSGNVGLIDFKTNPGDMDSGTINVEADEKYKLSLGNNFPTAYKVEVSYVGNTSETVTQNQTTSQTQSKAVVEGVVKDQNSNIINNPNVQIKIGNVNFMKENTATFNVELPKNVYIDFEISASGYKTGKWKKIFTDDSNKINFVLESEEKAEISVPQELYVGDYKVMQHKEYKGSLEMAQLGLVMKGDTHTNGRLVNGYRDGNRIDTVDSFNVKNKTVYGAFTVYGTNYCGYTGLAVDNIGGGTYVTTHHSWAGSKVVGNGTKLYKTLTFTDSTWKTTIAAGNYYGKSGSKLIQEKSGELSDSAKKAINSPQKIIFVFGDNYGGASNYMVVHDFFIEDNANNLAAVNSNTHINIDTASSWAVSEINDAASNNLTTENSTNNFKAFITREEFCEVIMKFYDAVGGKVLTNTSNPFNDTNNPEIVRAYHAKIVGGTTETTFSPYNNLTREQLCVMLVRALDAAGVNYSKNVDFSQDYSDKSFLSSWAYDSVKLLNGHKIFNGTGSELDPRGKVTKEVAIILMKRTFDKFK